MAAWDSISLKFDPLAPIEPPLKSVLTVLESVEAILEAVLGVVKAFSLDFSNPLKASVALLLAAVRTIINQLKNSGFSVLLVHPDFSRSDFGAVLSSVSGAYPGFENKVVSKFYDPSDVYRPMYPNGSSVAMIVLYVGAENPGDLLSQIFALLSFIKHPLILSGLPAPLSVKARPVNQSGSAISQFAKLFEPSLGRALQVEWKMPMSPAGGSAPGFVNSFVSFYQAYRFPNFVVERSTSPVGTTIPYTLKTQTVGKSILNLQSRFQFAQPETQVDVIENSGHHTLRHFEKKYPINSATGLLEGSMTGIYRFLDTDFTEADRGKNFYYRVRAYFGSPQNYLSGKYSDQVVQDRNQAVYKFDNGVVMSNPSPIARGYLPRTLPESGGLFNLYDDVARAIKVGLLLNFDLPPATAADSAERIRQKTGWGSLSLVGGQIGVIKSMCRTSTELINTGIFDSAARRIANQCISNLYMNPNLADLVAQKWAAGASFAVTTVEDAKIPWGVIGIKSGITAGANAQIEDYLAKEQSYNKYSKFDGPFPLDVLPSQGNGANPTQPLQVLGVDDRQALADFLHTALIPLSGQANYLSWYSVTIGDMIPSFIPFIFDFEQFLLAMLKATQSALTELEDIIQTLITKIEQLENILGTIISLLELFKIDVKVSILATSTSNGSAQSLVEALQESENKPGSEPHGLHSGLVLTAGGPGVGSIAALKSVALLFGIHL